MAAHDSTHWWYRARRDILADYLTRYGALPTDARILEIGCGTGHNLPMLARVRQRSRRSRSIPPRARSRASGWAGRSATRRCPTLPGVERGAYDLIAVLDVVEHIEDDVAALAAMATCLKPGGKILIAVPAHQWMWSAHDVVNHHHRRYSKATLRAAIAAAGLTPAQARLFQLAAVPARGGGAGRGAADRARRQRRFAPRQAAQRAVRKDLPAGTPLVGRVPMTPGRVDRDAGATRLTAARLWSHPRDTPHCPNPARADPRAPQSRASGPSRPQCRSC